MKFVPRDANKPAVGTPSEARDAEGVKSFHDSRLGWGKPPIPRRFDHHHQDRAVVRGKKEVRPPPRVDGVAMVYRPAAEGALDSISLTSHGHFGYRQDLTLRPQA